MPLIDPTRAQLPVVIIGAGLAGLTVALHLAVDHPVIVLAKRGLDEGATAWAQGGIVGVLGDDDSIDSHVRDTQDAGGLPLTREGGHAVRRIAHAADATGKAIHDVLLDEVRRHPNIDMRERWMAVDVITSRQLRRDEQPRCYGVYALDIDQQRVETLPARAMVLATGGVGKVYRYTSNPDTATGDGIAMAWRAGCHRSTGNRTSE